MLFSLQLCFCGYYDAYFLSDLFDIINLSSWLHNSFFAGGLKFNDVCTASSSWLGLLLIVSDLTVKLK